MHFFVYVKNFLLIFHQQIGLNFPFFLCNASAVHGDLQSQLVRFINEENHHRKLKINDTRQKEEEKKSVIIDESQAVTSKEILCVNAFFLVVDVGNWIRFFMSSLSVLVIGININTFLFKNNKYSDLNFYRVYFWKYFSIFYCKLGTNNSRRHDIVNRKCQNK